MEIPTTVFTISYNQKEVVKKTVRGLWEQDYPSDAYEIVVLDDGSVDGTPRVLDDLARRSPVPMKVLLKTHEADYLNAKRWNQCIAESSRESEVLIQVDDVTVRPDFIRRHARWHRSRELFLVTGAKFEGDEETWSLAACRRGRLAAPGGGPAETLFTAAWGASLSFSRRLAEMLTEPPHDLPYDERMVGWGYHEVEFAWRAKAAGARIVYDPAAGVFHKNHTTGSERRRGLNRNLLIAAGESVNRQYIKKKHRLGSLARW